MADALLAVAVTVTMAGDTWLLLLLPTAPVLFEAVAPDPDPAVCARLVAVGAVVAAAAAATAVAVMAAAVQLVLRAFSLGHSLRSTSSRSR